MHWRNDQMVIDSQLKRNGSMHTKPVQLESDTERLQMLHGIREILVA